MSGSRSTLRVFRFASVFLTALATAPALAHLLELRNKIHLPPGEYLIVQQIYRGWSLLGIVVIAAIVSTAGLAVAVRDRRRELTLVATALACLVVAHVVFWTFTYPVNRETDNWTRLPESWAALRLRWELSHAAGAGLHVFALAALILGAL